MSARHASTYSPNEAFPQQAEQLLPRAGGSPPRAQTWRPDERAAIKALLEQRAQHAEAVQAAEEAAQQQRVREYLLERKDRARAAAKYLKAQRAAMQEEFQAKADAKKQKEEKVAAISVPKALSKEQLRQQSEMAERGRVRYEEHMAMKRTNDYPLQIQRSAPLPAWASDPRKSALMMEVDTLLMKKRYDDLRLKIAEGEALGGLPLNKARCAVALYDVLSTIGEGCLRDPELQLPVLERAVKDAALSGLQVNKARIRLELERAMTMSDARSMNRVVEMAEEAGLPVSEHRKKVVRVKLDQLVDRVETGGMRAPKLEELEAAIRDAAGHGADIVLAAHLLNIETAARTGSLTLLLQALADGVVSLSRSEQAASRVFQAAWSSALAQVQERLQLESPHTLAERAGVLGLAAGMGMIDLEADVRKLIRAARLRQLTATGRAAEAEAARLLEQARATAAATGLEAAVQSRLSAMLDADQLAQAFELSEKFAMQEAVAAEVVAELEAETRRSRRGMAIATAHELSQANGGPTAAIPLLQRMQGPNAVSGITPRLLDDFAKVVTAQAASSAAAAAAAGGAGGAAAGGASSAAEDAGGGAPAMEGSADAAGEDASPEGEPGEAREAEPSGPPLGWDRPAHLVTALEMTVPLGVTVRFNVTMHGISHLRWLGLSRSGVTRKLPQAGSRGAAESAASVAPGTAADLRAALREAVSKLAKPKTPGHHWSAADMSHVLLGHMNLKNVVQVEVAVHALVGAKHDVGSLMKEREETRATAEAFMAALASKGEGPTAELFGPEVGTVTVSSIACSCWDRPVLPERLRQAVCLMFKRLEIEDDSANRKTLKRALVDPTDWETLRALTLAARAVTYGYKPFGRTERRVVVRRLPEALSAALAARSSERVAEVRELLQAMDQDPEAASMALLNSIVRAAAKRKSLREESEEEIRVAVPLLGVDMALRCNMALLFAAGDHGALNQAELDHRDLGMDTAALRTDVALAQATLALDAGDAGRVHEAMVLSVQQAWNIVVATAAAAGTGPTPIEPAFAAIVRRKLAEADRFRDVAAGVRLASVAAGSGNTPPEKLLRGLIVSAALRLCHGGMLGVLLGSDLTRREVSSALAPALTAAMERCSGAGLSGINVGAVRFLADVGVSLLTVYEREATDELMRELGKVIAWARAKEIAGFERVRCAVVHTRTNRVQGALGGLTFPSDSTDLPPQHLPTLEEIGKVLLELSPSTMVVAYGGAPDEAAAAADGAEGDADASAKAARALGYQRARGIIASMVRAYGHRGEALIPVGFAEGVDALDAFATGLAPFGPGCHVRFVVETTQEAMSSELRSVAAHPIMFSDEPAAAEAEADAAADAADAAGGGRKVAVSRRKRAAAADGALGGGGGGGKEAKAEAAARAAAAAAAYARRTSQYALIAELRAAKGTDVPEGGAFTYTIAFAHSLTASDLVETTLLHLAVRSPDVKTWGEVLCNLPEDAPLLPHEALFDVVYNAKCLALCASERLLVNESVQFALRAAFALRRRVIIVEPVGAPPAPDVTPDDLLPLLAAVRTWRLDLEVHMRRDSVLKRIMFDCGIDVLTHDADPEAGEGGEDGGELRGVLNGVGGAARLPPMRVAFPPAVAISTPSTGSGKEAAAAQA